MTDFQVTIFSPGPVPAEPSPGSAFEVRQQSGGAKALLNGIDDLSKVWDQVIDRLSDLAVKSQARAANAPYQLEEIEFNIGIEAGLNIGLVTKGDASVTVKFARRRDAGG